MKGFKQLVLATVTVGALGCFTSAMAFPPMPSGWYVEGNVGSTRVSNVTYATNSSITSSGYGYNINAGYKFIPYFAGEIGYTKYANAKGQVNGVTVATASNYSYDAAVRGILPIADSGAEAFAKLGIARLKSTVTENNSSYVIANGIVVNTGSNSATGYYYGLGADYVFWQAAAVNAQWQRAHGNSKTGNFDLFSLGLSYSFA